MDHSHDPSGHGHSHGHNESAHESDAHDCADGGPLHVTRAPEVTLSAEWIRAESLFHALEDGRCGDADASARATENALAAFTRCDEWVRRAALFSSNEEVSDVSTLSLQFVLCDFYLGVLLSRTLPGPARMPAIRRARAHFCAFIERALRFLPAGEDWRKAAGLDADEESDDDASAATGGGRGVGESMEGARRRVLRARGGGADPGAARAAKIERYRRTQACKARLAALTEERARGDARGVDDEDAPDGVGSRASVAGGGLDDDRSRDVLLCSIELAARRVIDELAAIAVETPLLMHAERARDDAPRAGGGGGAVSDARTPMRGGGPPPNDMSVAPDRPGLSLTHIDPTFQITSEVFKATIFQQGHLFVLYAARACTLQTACVIFLITRALPPARDTHWHPPGADHGPRRVGRSRHGKDARPDGPRG